METSQRKNHSNSVNLKRKYIRLQVVGMSFGLSILPAIMLAYMFNLGAFAGQIATLLAVVGCVFFFFGLVGRQELAAKWKENSNLPDCPVYIPESPTRSRISLREASSAAGDEKEEE